MNHCRKRWESRWGEESIALDFFFGTAFRSRPQCCCSADGRGSESALKPSRTAETSLCSPGQTLPKPCPQVDTHTHTRTSKYVHTYSRSSLPFLFAAAERRQKSWSLSSSSLGQASQRAPAAATVLSWQGLNNAPHPRTCKILTRQVGLENGVRYPLAARHRGIDPWLFLDLRAARKWVLDNSGGKEVLNLFSYTGGVAAAAACGGATSVWNVDFASSAHEVRRGGCNGHAGSVRVHPSRRWRWWLVDLGRVILGSLSGIFDRSLSVKREEFRFGDGYCCTSSRSPNKSRRGRSTVPWRSTDPFWLCWCDGALGNVHMLVEASDRVALLFLLVRFGFVGRSIDRSKVGKASLKLNAASAGECECEWMKRDVSGGVQPCSFFEMHVHTYACTRIPSTFCCSISLQQARRRSVGNF